VPGEKGSSSPWSSSAVRLQAIQETCLRNFQKCPNLESTSEEVWSEGAISASDPDSFEIGFMMVQL